MPFVTMSSILCHPSAIRIYVMHDPCFEMRLQLRILPPTPQAYDLHVSHLMHEGRSLFGDK